MNIEIKELIQVYSNNLHPEFCDHLIQKFESDDRKHPGKVIGNNSNSELCIQPECKISFDLHITSKSGWKNEDSILYQSLRQPLNDYVNHCKSILQLIDFGSKITDSGYQIQRTRPGEYYHWHHDWHYKVNIGTRIITYIWYLNDINYDGETEFIDGTKIKPEQGKLLLFPSTWTYVHRGVSPLSEVKYICTGWIYSNYD